MDQSVTQTSLEDEQARRARIMQELKRLGLLLAVVALLVLGLRAWSAHRAGQRLTASAEAAAVPPVATVRGEPVSGAAELTLPGSLQANYEAPIFARTSGYLKRWLTDIGTPVKQGQLLAEIDTPEIEQQLRQAQAELANAEANQKLAQLTAERWRNLRATDSVSRQEADEKIAQATALDAQAQSARANVQRLRELSGFRRIVAPFDGVITARETDVGQLIDAGSGSGRELFRIADMRRVRLYVRVPQNYAQLMRPGLIAQVEFPDRPGRRFEARLDSTASALDAASRTLLAQLIIENPGRELLPGSYSEVRFSVPANDGNAATLRLPGNVLLFRGEGPRVATVDAQGRVQLRPVTIGRDLGAEVEITGGISAQDRVIVSPPDAIDEGMRVRVVNPGPAAGAARP